MTRYLVTGASGLLGLNFALQHCREHEVTGLVNHNSLRNVPFRVVSADLAEPGQAERLLEELKPEVVLHCAAMANLDECELKPELARRVNAEVPGELARAAARQGVRLVHLSTDAVFDGTHGPYSEEDIPNPLSVYAHSKMAGEQAVLQANPDALVARVNFYGWSMTGKRSLGEFFYYNLLAGKPMKGFTDVFFCPLEVTILGEILAELAGMDCGGLYHVVSSECLTKYDFGCAVARAFGLDASLIEPVSVAAGGLRAARSPDLRLNTSKLSAALGRPVPGQAECMQRFVEYQQAGYPQQLLGMAG